jgi:hypothetical protein
MTAEQPHDDARGDVGMMPSEDRHSSELPLNTLSTA